MCVWPASAAVTNITHGGPAHATIQAAVNAAVSGDTLLVGVGHYAERVTISQKSLVLKGGYWPNFVTRTNVPHLTCINAGAAGTALTVSNNCTVVLEYVMITNGAAATGGGILLFERAALTAQYCAVALNTATMGGGIAVTSASTLVLHDTSVSNNTANSGGGLYLASTSVAVIGSATQIEHNRATSSGGAIFAGGSALTLANCQIASNTAGSSGGGFWLRSSGALTIINGVILSDNHALNGAGGAIACSGPWKLTIADAAFISNRAASLGGALAAYSCTVLVQRATMFLDNAAHTGGALALSNSVVTLEAGQQAAPLFLRNKSLGSTSTSGGGAIYAVNGTRLSGKNLLFAANTSSNSGGAIWLRNATAHLAADFAEWPGGDSPPLLFSNNVAATGNGGAIHLSHGSAGSLADALCVGNSASTGGGIYLDNSTVDVVNTVLYNNSAGIRSVAGHVRARHSTIVGNAYSGISGIASASVSNCIIRGHSTNVDPGKDVHYSNIGGGYATGTGNIDADPLFSNPAGHNFALAFLSPCVDTGANLGITNDCIGARRPLKAGYDMGAYEMNPTPLQLVSPTLLNFGDVMAGESTQLLVHIASRSSSVLSGAVMYVPVPIFTVTPSSYVVPGLTSIAATVTFAPPLVFVWTQTVVFASNGGSQDVVLTGRGLPEPAALTFLVLMLPALRRNSKPNNTCTKSGHMWCMNHRGG